jgi:gas vesicle protein
MGDTIDALGYKADVPARAKDAVSERVGRVKTKVGGVGSHLSDAAPDGHEVAEGARRAAGVARENPLGLAIGGAAAGFLAGMLIPSTRIEDERIGPAADQVKEQARLTGQEALDHGRQIVQETAETAAEKAQEAVAEVKDEAQRKTQDHAEDLGQSAKQSVEQLSDSHA